MTQNFEWLEPQTPDEIITEAIEKYNLDSLYVLYSGGKDSVCVLDYVARNYPKKFKGAVFTNVGLGAQATRRFVLDYCKRKRWKLWMTWPHSERDRFYNVLMKFGFAFPGTHRMWMGFLKQHSWYYFMKDRISGGEKPAFISGVRKKESFRRNKISQYTKTPTDVDSHLIYIKPFLYKNGSQLWDYYIEHKLEKTPVYDWLNRSGECYCGAFIEKWELKMLEKYDPLAFNTIQWYENQMALKLEVLIKENNITENDMENWLRIMRIPHLKDSLSDLQKNVVCLKYFNRWGNGESTEDAMAQTTLDEIFGTKMKLNEDYCGESCTAQ